MCLPTVYHESKGLSVLEALANAVPVVVPDHGTFPELIRNTGGGLLYDPSDARALPKQLKRLLLNAGERPSSEPRASRRWFATIRPRIWQKRRSISIAMSAMNY